MKQIGQAFENFAFKAFDFNGRASLLEYWVVMPTIWAVIIFLAVGDAQEFWGMLLARQVPPLNPLYWDAILVFLLTLIPRLSLTVRRLHDCGKSGKWAKLPYVCLISSFWLVLGFGSAVLTSNIGSHNEQTMAALSLFAIFAFSSFESAWDAIFGVAAVMNAMGLDAIIAVLAEVFAPAENINVNRGFNNAVDGLQSKPVEGATLAALFIVLVATPFVTAMLHLFFMISPPVPEDERLGAMKMTGASLRRKGEVSANPFEGYKYLYERSPEQEAADKEAAKEEIRSLYQQRVLGQQPG